LRDAEPDNGWTLGRGPRLAATAGYRVCDQGGVEVDVLGRDGELRLRADIESWVGRDSACATTTRMAHARPRRGYRVGDCSASEAASAGRFLLIERTAVRSSCCRDRSSVRRAVATGSRVVVIREVPRRCAWSRRLEERCVAEGQGMRRRYRGCSNAKADPSSGVTMSRMWCKFWFGGTLAVCRLQQGSRRVLIRCGRAGGCFVSIGLSDPEHRLPAETRSGSWTERETRWLTRSGRRLAGPPVLGMHDRPQRSCGRCLREMSSRVTILHTAPRPHSVQSTRRLPLTGTRLRGTARLALPS
jgi:hypothetical protein